MSELVFGDLGATGQGDQVRAGTRWGSVSERVFGDLGAIGQGDQGRAGTRWGSVS